VGLDGCVLVPRNTGPVGVIGLTHPCVRSAAAQWRALGRRLASRRITFGHWTGALAGTPAAEPHLFANNVAVCDLM